MILTDFIVLLGLAVCLWLWWKRGFAHRSRWLVVMSLLVIAVSIWSLVDDRWQAVVALFPVSLMLLGLLIGRKRGRKGVPWISGTLLSLLAGLAFLAIYFFPITDLPVPSGEYAVGVRDFELQDIDRPGLIAAGPAEPRRLLVRVWYPADDTEGLEVRRYFSAAEVDTTAESIGRFLNAPFAFKYLKHVKTNSFEGAPLIYGFDALPVVIYSHGYTSFAGQNTALMEELASHGYAVYSIQHTFDSGPTVFPNGDVLDSDPKLLEDMRALAEPSEAMKQGFIGKTFSARREGQLQSHHEAIAGNQRIVARSAPIWTDDRNFVLDQLQAGSVPASVQEIVAASNFEHTGQIGMSFGGSATGEVCYLDPRCAAGVNLDGGDFHFSPFGQNMPVPFLMFYSDYNLIARMFSGDPEMEGHGFNDFSYERPETAGLRPDVVRLKVNSATHLGVSDFSLFVRRPLRNPLFGAIDSDDMIQIQNDFVLAFFDKYVRQKQNGFPAEQFQEHQEWVDAQDMSDLRMDWLQANPQDQTLQVVLETSAGEIEVALYPQRAPLGVAQFLAAVDTGAYNGGKFHRVESAMSDNTFEQVQGGPAATHMEQQLPSDLDSAESAPPPESFESGEQTGINYQAGTLALLPVSAGSAVPEFVINVDDNRLVEPGSSMDELTGQRFSAIGRVLRGLPLLRHIQPVTAGDVVAGELPGIQNRPQSVTIVRAYRQD